MISRGTTAASVLLALGLTAASADDRRSGLEVMSPATQAMQADDAANPGMLSVLEGESLFATKAGTAGSACADCHGDGAQSMRGVAARYPAFDDRRGGPIDLEGRIAACRRERQGDAGAQPEDRAGLALAAYVAHQSRGLPITAGSDERLAQALARGRLLYERRMGQLDLSCASCHEGEAGRRLGGSPVPQALPTGYPLYRLEWQDLGSLRRRLRNCVAGVRAEPFPDGSPEIVELELFLMAKARGMPMETPAVRP